MMNEVTVINITIITLTAIQSAGRRPRLIMAKNLLVKPSRWATKEVKVLRIAKRGYASLVNSFLATLSRILPRGTTSTTCCRTPMYTVNASVEFSDLATFDVVGMQASVTRRPAFLHYREEASVINRDDHRMVSKVQKLYGPATAVRPKHGQKAKISYSLNCSG